MQEVIVMCEGHEGVGQLPQPLFDQTGHCVDGVVFQTDQMRVYDSSTGLDNQSINQYIRHVTGLTAVTAGGAHRSPAAGGAL